MEITHVHQKATFCVLVSTPKNWAIKYPYHSTKDNRKRRTAAKRKDFEDVAGYTLKALIPLNAIVRLIDKQDVYAGLGLVANVLISSVPVQGMAGVGAAANLSIRAANYSNMLKGQIKNTQEAIDFLEDRLKELKKKK